MCTITISGHCCDYGLMFSCDRIFPGLLNIDAGDLLPAQGGIEEVDSSGTRKGLGLSLNWQHLVLYWKI